MSKPKHCDRCGIVVNDPLLLRPDRIKSSHGLGRYTFTLCKLCKEICTHTLVNNDGLIYKAMSKYGIFESHSSFDDIYQELVQVFWKCLINLDTSQGASLSTYVYGSMSLAMRSILTKQHSYGFTCIGRTDSGAMKWIDAPLASLDDWDESSDKNIAVDTCIPEHEAEASEYERLLVEAIESLPERTEKVVRLRWFKHMTYEEIGDEIGVCKERVRQILSDSNKMLRSKLEGLFDE